MLSSYYLFFFCLVRLLFCLSFGLREQTVGGAVRGKGAVFLSVIICFSRLLGSSASCLVM